MIRAAEERGAGGAVRGGSTPGLSAVCEAFEGARRGARSTASCWCQAAGGREAAARSEVGRVRTRSSTRAPSDRRCSRSRHRRRVAAAAAAAASLPAMITLRPSQAPIAKDAAERRDRTLAATAWRRVGCSADQVRPAGVTIRRVLGDARSPKRPSRTFPRPPAADGAGWERP